MMDVGPWRVKEILVVQACCAGQTMQGLCNQKGCFMVCRLILLLGGFLVFFILFFTTEWIFKARALEHTISLIYISQ